jgi:hypothetical protein
MSETISDLRPANTDGATSISGSNSRTGDPTDTPIPLWPEGVLAVLASAVLVAIGLRHRVFLQRKATEVQRAVEEFQRQGGIEDLTQVARQASEFLQGAAK